MSWTLDHLVPGAGASTTLMALTPSTSARSSTSCGATVSENVLVRTPIKLGKERQVLGGGQQDAAFAVAGEGASSEFRGDTELRKPQASKQNEGSGEALACQVSLLHPVHVVATRSVVTIPLQRRVPPAWHPRHFVVIVIKVAALLDRHPCS